MTELNAAIANLKAPMRIARLPISKKGFYVPWFVAMIDGEWDFRIMGTGKLETAVLAKRCWICGDVLGQYKCFVIGPMCSINRISAEPPSHVECAQYAVQACPFLVNPRMRRNMKDMPPEKIVSGIMIERNPGVTVLWVTKTFKVVSDGSDGVLFSIGDPTNVMWYAEGRTAARAEVDESIRTGLPILTEAANSDGPDAIAALAKMTESVKQYLPVA